jgi:hypothetical protein
MRNLSFLDDSDVQSSSQDMGLDKKRLSPHKTNTNLLSKKYFSKIAASWLADSQRCRAGFHQS